LYFHKEIQESGYQEPRQKPGTAQFDFNHHLL
jgi:hypothetical protein